MPSCQAKTRKILTVTVIIFFAVFLTLCIAKAQNNQGGDVSSIDSHFDQVRGQLIGFYGSQIVSHAGIILGLIIAIATFAPRLFRGLKSKKFAWCFVAFLVILLLGTLIVYTTGRLFYWSSLDAYLEHATRQSVENKLHINITASNATSCMDALSNYTVTSTESSFGLSSISNLTKYPYYILAAISGVEVAIVASVRLWQHNDRMPKTVH
jgi:hypothetical protein